MSAKLDVAGLTGVDPEVAELKAELLTSLRRLKGRGTVGDVAAEAGLPTEDVRSGLKALLESHRGHLAVADSGELLYEFDPRLIIKHAQLIFDAKGSLRGHKFNGETL